MEKAIRKTRLPNGIRILTKKMPHVRSVSAGVWVEAGARDESESNAGAGHFIEHMVFKGTPTRSAYDIAVETDALGGHTNAFTGMEHTCYHGKVLDSLSGRLMGILSDIFLNSVFDPVELDRERDVILQEIHMLEDTPEDYLQLMMGRAFYGKHPLGRSILGTEDSLARLDRDSLKKHLSDWYFPDNIIIAAAGNLDHDAFLEAAMPGFAAIEPGEAPARRSPPQPLAGTDIREKDLEQVHLCLATPALSSTDERRHALYILNTLLGGNMSSRLFQEIRERRGLAYSVYSWVSPCADSGMLAIYAGVNPDDVEETLSLVRDGMRAFVEKPVSEKELSQARDYIMAGVFLSSESTDSQMIRLIQNEVHFGRHVPLMEIAEMISKVTAEDVLELAAQILDPERAALAILGPVDPACDYAGVLHA
ncbi:MAG: insulinase family protein [Deltaproteobacteria bacterium]|nr:insulinase family protein [Deltaproteobacteria bacterium]